MITNGLTERIKSELKGVDWEEFMEGRTADIWAKFKEMLLRLEEKYVPVTRVKSKGKAPWITYKALGAVRRKRRVYTRYKDKSHPACKKANGDATRLVREAKRNYEARLAENIRTDEKSFDAYVRSMSRTRDVGVNLRHRYHIFKGEGQTERFERGQVTGGR